MIIKSDSSTETIYVDLHVQDIASCLPTKGREAINKEMLTF
jgi:hypothetical protein